MGKAARLKARRRRVGQIDGDVCPEFDDLPPDADGPVLADLAPEQHAGAEGLVAAEERASRFGAVLRSIRLWARLEQGEIAEALGVNVRTIRRWETGTTLPDQAGQLDAVAGVIDRVLAGRQRKRR